MIWGIALILIVQIAINLWTERRISALERRWNEFLDQQQQAGHSHALR